MTRFPPRPIPAPRAPAPDQTTLRFNFTQIGRYLIAAGSEHRDGRSCFGPVLYIIVAGEKGWATQYPLDGKFTKDHEAAAAALRYGVQIITGKVQDVRLPDDPFLLSSASEVQESPIVPTRYSRGDESEWLRSRLRIP